MKISKNELLKIILTKTNVYCRETYFKKLFPENHQEILSISFPHHFKFNQKLYHYIYDISLTYGYCKICGHPTRFKGFGQGYSTYCSSNCLSNDDEFKQKISDVWHNLTDEEKNNINNKKHLWWESLSDNEKNTKIQKCKQTWRNKSNEDIQHMSSKIKSTWKNKTREELDIIKNKKSITLSKNPQTVQLINIKHKKYWENLSKEEKELFSNKIKKSWLSKSEEERNEIIQKSVSSRINRSENEKKITLQKVNETKRKNKSFNTSNIEIQFKTYLQSNNISYICEYNKDVRYPFNCDFYLPYYDLFIEINGHWTHGQHPFDKNNENDILTLNLWKSKNTEFYDNAINVWTKRDVNKRTIAKTNNLNYLEIFSDKIDIVIEKFETYLNDFITKP